MADKLKKSIFKRWWFWLIVVLVIIIIIAASSGGKKTGQNALPPINNTAANTGGTTTAQTGTANAQTGTANAQTGSVPGTNNNAQAQNPQGQITFNNIIFNNTLGSTMVNGEVKNTGSQACSFTLKVSFYDQAKKLLGTAVGAVNELNGGSTKLFSALATSDYSKAASYKVQVDTVVATTPNKADVISFSNIILNNSAGLGMVEGECKNKDSVAHSFTVSIGLYDSSNKLIGVATGAVNDLAAGDTKTFSALVTGESKNVKKFVAYVDSMVK